MSAGFHAAPGGGARVEIAPEEAAVIRLLIGQLLELIGGQDAAKGVDGLPDLGMPDIGLSENTAPSDDPVLARLFPDAYREDPDASADFRRYTEAGLRDGKRAAARVVLDTVGDGGEIVLDDDQAQAWLCALNDLRLALGTRLGLTEESQDELRSLDWNDPRSAPFAAYDWLTYLQGTLIDVLAGSGHA